MPNHILTVTRNSLSDPWPSEINETLTAFGNEMFVAVQDQAGCNNIDLDISEDGLVKTITFEFDTQENLDAWKLVQESLTNFAENLSDVQSMNADESSVYSFTDSLQGY